MTASVDPLYFLFLFPGVLLALWAQWRMQSAYQEAGPIPSRNGLSGARAARHLLRDAGVAGVEVELGDGVLTDHYDPADRVLRMSPDVFSGHSLASVGIAAHEAGHALQDAAGYPLLPLRTLLAPTAGVGSSLAWVLFAGGFALSSVPLVKLGILAFCGTLLLQLVTLPVEFDASRRAHQALLDRGLITPLEDETVRNVLAAAAWANVAAALTGVLTLVQFLFRLGAVTARR
jgi:Zn-dependent membrane protease YugP